HLVKASSCAPGNSLNFSEGLDQNVTPPTSFAGCGPDDAVLLHTLDELRSFVVPDTKLSLKVTDRAVSGLRDDGYAAVVEGVVAAAGQGRAVAPVVVVARA